MRVRLAAALLALPVGCTVSQDPTQGGLIGGIAGTLGGGYERRAEALRSDVEVARAENRVLRRQYEAARSELVRLRDGLAAAGRSPSPALQRAIDRVLDARPRTSEELRWATVQMQSLAPLLTRYAG